MGAVDQEADRHFRLAQQPLEAMVRCSLPVARILGGDLVEVGARGDDLNEHQPFGSCQLSVVSCEFGNGVGGAQRVVVFRQRDDQVVSGPWSVVFATDN
jgi:hypothetical protein